jgi:hypothetical protein
MRAIAINDDGGKVGSAVPLDVTPYFTGTDLVYSITSVEHPTVADTHSFVDADPDGIIGYVVMPVIQSIMPVSTPTGMFTITPMHSGVAKDDYEVPYSSSKVTVRATDSTGLWAEQVVMVHRNRKPNVDRDPRADEQQVYLGTNTRKSQTYRIRELFNDDDDIDVTEQFNSFADVAVLGIDNLIGSLRVSMVKAGVTEITVRAEDTGGLTATSELSVFVYQGPVLKKDAPTEVTLSQASSSTDGAQTFELQDVFVTVATKNPYGDDVSETTADGLPSVAAYGAAGTETERDVTSTNEAVATAEVISATGIVTVTTNSVGTTTLEIPVTQITGPTPDVTGTDSVALGLGTEDAPNDRFEQSVTVKVTVNIVP